MTKNIPIFRRDNLMYKREEKEGYWTIIPKFHPETRELVINKTAVEILELCDGTRKIEDIENCVKNRYPDVSIELIKKDIDATLGRFSRLLVIEWLRENPFLYRRKETLSDDLSLMIGQEEDILKIKDFINISGVLQTVGNESENSGSLLYRNPLTASFEYEEVTLRVRLFTYTEDFFLLLKKDKILGLVSIASPLSPQFTSWIIKLIIAPKEHFTNLLKYSQDSLPFISVSKITKIRLYEILNKPIDSELKGILLKEGYKEEMILEHEVGFNNHLRSYARIYSPKFIKKII